MCQARGYCRLKVLIVHEMFPPDFGGGGEYVILETARHLMLRGHTVQVLCTGDPAITYYEGISNHPAADKPLSNELRYCRSREVRA